MTDKGQMPPPPDDLEPFFTAARRHPEEPSMPFLAQLLADATQAAEAAGAASSRHPSEAGLAGVWRQMRDMLRGWPAQGGLAAAGLAGLALGLTVPPDAVFLGDLAGLVLGQPADAYLVDLGPALDFELAMDLNGG